jgi:AcrR family transcriptional regulator
MFNQFILDKKRFASYIAAMGRKSISTLRKQQIVEAFYEVAKEEGLESASIAKIAHKMGINPSLIIHYFKTREELIFALIEFNLEKYSQLYQSDDRAHLSALAYLVKLIDHLFSREWGMLYDDSVYYSCYALIFRDQKIKEKYKGLHDSLRDMLADVILKAKQAGSIEVTDVKKTAELVFIILEGAYYYLGMVTDAKEYNQKMLQYKEAAFQLLGIPSLKSVS